MVREEFFGNFRDLADELLRTKIMSAKAGSGTVVELCQFQGKPFTVQVPITGAPAAGAPVISLVIGSGIALAIILLVVLFVVLFVVLVQKGASDRKAVLWVAGALQLLLAIALP